MFLAATKNTTLTGFSKGKVVPVDSHTVELGYSFTHS
jgi:hypothetical protein